jgi:hypothetical protein
MVGVVTYIFVSDLIKQRNEREMELQAVRDNVAENDNFNGALSDRQEVRITNHQGGRAEITNGIANGDNQMRLVGADITVNGDARHDLSRNPRHIMAVGEGNMNNTNVGSIFQLARSREASVDPANSLNELSVAGFEKLLREARESSKKFYDRELSADEESNLEVAKNFLKSGVYNNISKESPNLVFVLRDQEYQKQIEEKAKQEDEGAGVFSAGRRGQSPCPSIEQDLGIPVPNPELEIQSAFASALESLKSPRGDVRSSQAVEMHCDINQLMQSQQVFRAIKALEKKLPQDKSGAR